MTDRGRARGSGVQQPHDSGGMDGPHRARCGEAQAGGADMNDQRIDEIKTRYAPRAAPTWTDRSTRRFWSNQPSPLSRSMFSRIS